ncbi:MAG TPA: type II secretion system F family protein [Terriglobales bacterium]|nr:type II secretion system F family protein [Terriglobales bacterium]
MSEFLIKMADERGHLLQQVETGYSESEVRDRYAQQGYLVYWVKPRGILAGGDVSLFQRRKIKLEQFVIFNQQFVTLIKAGLPILNSLDLLIRRQRNGYFKTLLENVRDRVKSGELLSNSFAAQAVFPKLYTTTLLAGEKSGNLEEVLNRYIAFQRLTISFRKKLKASLVYPTLLVVMVVSMLSFLVTYVVPRFGELYQSVDAQLPAMTMFMVALGTGARKYLFLFIGSAIVLAVLLWRWKNSERGADQIDRFLLHVPIAGAVLLKYQVANFARILATLLTGGLPLVPALETAGESVGSKHIANGIVEAARRVREGLPLARSLEERKIFPDLAVEMIEVGESTGALPAMLASVAEFYEEDVQAGLTAAMSLIEPVILIFMGTIVAFVLISLYLPIFTLGAGGFH